MRLSDLLHCEVIDEEQRKIGRVHEVRAVQDGPLQGAFGAALRVEGLIVGRGSVGTRLGLDRKDVKALAVVRLIFEGLRGERLFVRWNRIVAIEKDRIVVSGEDNFEPAEQLSSTEQGDAWEVS
jgi:sporulation protein YlmC with PRC-barrel domain